MIDPEEEYKQIDDIIDARKKLGFYDVGKQQSAPINYRYAYSATNTPACDKFIRFDDTMMLINEGDYLNNTEIKRTDSEITVVRVRRDGLAFKRRASKWNMMHDIAIPGDGSHLGESPSMVNLATLVQQNDEYLVPLSSWDPYYKTDEAAPSTEEEDSAASSPMSGRANNNADDSSCDSPTTLKVEEVCDEDRNDNKSCSNASQFSEDNGFELDLKSISSVSGRRPSLADRISKFVRKHVKKSKTLPAETGLVKKDSKRFSKN